ncbi:hypothetical protein LTR08_008394 [Meristemomyces frigidus]|nr:hypothetical protein LTR08_008394 [Meristemomyces frigidus]
MPQDDIVDWDWFLATTSQAESGSLFDLELPMPPYTLDDLLSVSCPTADGTMPFSQHPQARQPGVESHHAISLTGADVNAHQSESEPISDGKIFCMPSLPSYAAYPESDHELNQLADLRLKMADLPRSLMASTKRGPDHRFPDCSSVAKNIQGVYTITQNFAEISKRLTTPTSNVTEIFAVGGSITPPQSVVSAHQASVVHSPRPTPPPLSTLLLLISYYVQLVHLYEVLVQTLQDSCKVQTSQQSARPGMAAAQNALPLFRMANSRFAVPPAASLGMHLVATGSMIQLLKDTMFACVCGDRQTARTKDHNTAEGGAGNSTSAKDSSPALALAEMALSELSLREERLHTALRDAVSHSRV